MAAKYRPRNALTDPAAGPDTPGPSTTAELPAMAVGVDGTGELVPLDGDVAACDPPTARPTVSSAGVRLG